VRGVAAKAGNILTPAPTSASATPNTCTWGEDIIVTAAALRDRRPASALTFVEVATLSRQALDEVLAAYPDSRKIIQQAAMKIAMQRAIVVVSEYIKISKAERRAGSPPPDEPSKGDAASSHGAASPDMLASIRSRLVMVNGMGAGDAVHAGAEILQMMTGKPFRELDAEQENPLVNPPAGSPGMLNRSPSSSRTVTGVDVAAFEAIKTQLVTESQKRAALAAEVRSIKGNVERILELLQARPAD